MKERRIYYSRKNKRIIIEGKQNNETIYLYGLPDPIKLLKSLNIEEEKKAKIFDKISRLDSYDKDKKEDV